MNCARIAGTLLFVGAVLAIGLLAPPWSDAQIVSPDRNIGAQSERIDSLTEGAIVIPNDEPTGKDRKQGFERPLNVPDRMEDANGTHLRLRTPDQSGADTAPESESEERASTSF